MTSPRRIRRRASSAVAAAFALVAVCVGAVRADTPPNGWERARKPGATAAWTLHVTVQELMARNDEEELQFLNGASLERARVLLEEGGAAASSEPLLRFDLGEVYEALSLHEQAIVVLKGALAAAPDTPASTNAWMTLAYAYAKLARDKEEAAAYREYLKRVRDDQSRATALLNDAEAEMHMGNMDEAVAQYRESIRVAASVPFSQSADSTGTLAVWGLAVALDRAGDPRGALEEARVATRRDPGERLIGHGENVFFVPAYERDWYLGLGAMVHAREADTKEKAARYWAVAEDFWTKYVTDATEADRWRTLAKAHRDHAHRERVAADKRVGSSPRRKAAPPPEEDEEGATP